MGFKDISNIAGSAMTAQSVRLNTIASNLANDYYDFVKGYDQTDRKGPLRVALSGLISLKELRLGLILVLAMSAVIGLYLIYVGGWPILIVGVAAMICAVIYSGGPFPLSAHGLGFFGLAAVAGTYYVQALTMTPLVLVAALPPGFLITAILVVNNLRDIDSDRRVGKKTLAVRIGTGGTRWEYTLLLAGAYAVPVVLVVLALGRSDLAAAPFLILLLPWLTILRAARIRRMIYTAADGPTMNLALAMTAKLSLTYSILFAIGLAFYSHIPIFTTL